MNEAFRKFAQATATVVGSSWTFLLAILVIVVWGVTGPYFHYSDTWQLVINTGTSVITFLMVFIIQNSQNRDAKALHLKIDELLRAVEGARTGLVNLETLSEEDVLQLEREFQRLSERHGRKPLPPEMPPAAPGT